MKEYMLIARGDRKVWDAMKEADWEPVMEGFSKWIKGMEEKKLWIRGDRLTQKRMDVQKDPDRGFRVLDGPFTETKEALSGLFLFRAENMNQAVELAKGCPSLLHDDLELYEMEGDR